MNPPSPDWSPPRKQAANLVASLLYGVMAIMLAELAVSPDEMSDVSYADAAGSALLAGVAMLLARFFVEMVKAETVEGGRRIGWRMIMAIMRENQYVIVYPALITAGILFAGRFGFSGQPLIDAVFYLSVVAVFGLGFGSSYVLDRAFRPALTRGLVWTVLSLVLFAARRLV